MLHNCSPWDCRATKFISTSVCNIDFPYFLQHFLLRSLRILNETGDRSGNCTPPVAGHRVNMTSRPISHFRTKSTVESHSSMGCGGRLFPGPCGNAAEKITHLEIYNCVRVGSPGYQIETQDSDGFLTQLSADLLTWQIIRNIQTKPHFLTLLPCRRSVVWMYYSLLTRSVYTAIISYSVSQSRSIQVPSFRVNDAICHS